MSFRAISASSMAFRKSQGGHVCFEILIWHVSRQFRYKFSCNLSEKSNADINPHHREGDNYMLTQQVARYVSNQQNIPIWPTLAKQSLAPQVSPCCSQRPCVGQRYQPDFPELPCSARHGRRFRCPRPGRRHRRSFRVANFIPYIRSSEAS